MLQSFKCFWNGNKIFPGSYTELGVVPPASSASKTSPPSRLHINDGSPFAMDCTSTRSSRTTSSLSPISSPSRQNSISSLSPRLRSRSDDESMNEEAQVVPQNTTVTTVENNQEITTTTKTATTSNKFMTQAWRRPKARERERPKAERGCHRGTPFGLKLSLGPFL